MLSAPSSKVQGVFQETPIANSVSSSVRKNLERQNAEKATAAAAAAAQVQLTSEEQATVVQVLRSALQSQLTQLDGWVMQETKRKASAKQQYDA